MDDGAPSAYRGKAAVGWADLLWLLHTLAPGERAGAAALLGFAEKREKEADIAPILSKDESKQETTKPPADAPARRPPLRATHFAVVNHESFPDQSSEDLEIESNGLLLDSVGAEAAPTPPFLYLSPKRRMAVFLRSHLRERRSIPSVDVGRLLHHLTRASVPERLPRQQRLCWTSDAALVIDFSLACVPLRADLIELAETAHALSGGRLRVLWFDAAQGWLLRQPGRRAEWKPVGERVLRASRHWLVVGNLGVSGPDAPLFCKWSRRIGRHIDRGGEATFLTGGFVPEVRKALPGRARATSWERGHRFKLMPVRRLPHGVVQGDVERLLAALSMAVVIEPALLRAIRLALGLSTAVELAAWNHPDAEPCLIGMQLRRDRLVAYRQCLRLWPLETRQQVAGLVEAHHAAHSRLIRLEEAALAADLASWNVDTVRNQWAAVLDTVQQAPEGDAARELRAYLHRTGMRAHPDLWRTVPALEHAYVVARRKALVAGGEVPAGVSVAVLNRLLPDGRLGKDAMPLCIAEREGQLMVCADPPEGGRAWPLVRSPDDTGFKLSAPGRPRQWYAVDELPLPLGRLMPGAGPWTIETVWVRATVAEVPRPSWAMEWERMGLMLYAHAPSPFGLPVRLEWAPPGHGDQYFWPPSARGFNSDAVPVGEGGWMGADLQFGLYLDIPFGSTLQRFRWIEPGEFVMGSPEAEVGRSDGEGPQHTVLLTEAFWLAETACSQAVWESVMGSNPSRFNDNPQNPVEQVSWDDVQEFLQKVEKRLPGVTVGLPTEAEWEYACRAGSKTAFSWGEEIDPSWANYDASETYAHGLASECLGKTVGVRSFTPNSWGLFQMNGNVDEWCMDSPRRYDGQLQTNPRGPMDKESGSVRAIRGGAWNDHPRRLRASFRSQGACNWRDDDLGFRLSLRPR